MEITETNVMSFSALQVESEDGVKSVAYRYLEGSYLVWINRGVLCVILLRRLSAV